MALVRPSLALWGVTAALSIFGAAQGLSYPLFALLMQGQGNSAASIGLSAAMMPFGFILCSFLLPSFVGRFGASRVAIVGALLGALCFLSIGLLQNWIAWYPLRFFMGLVINPLFVLGEVWALALSPPEVRGRTMGYFHTLFGAGYAVGPLVLMIVGIEGFMPFLIAICGFLLCTGVLIVVSPALHGFHREGEPSLGVIGFAMLAPAMLVSVLVSSSMQQSLFSLLPVLGSGYGVAVALLAVMVTAVSVGNVCLQVPLGLLSERFGAQRMLIVCAMITSCCAALLPLLILTPAAWLLLAMMGGCGYGVYTMCVIQLGERFRGSLLMAGNSAFALAWGVGGILGPPASGMVMEAVGVHAFPMMISALFLSLAVFNYIMLAGGRRSR